MVIDEIVNGRTDRVVGQVQKWREHLLLIYEQLFFAPLRLCGNLPSVRFECHTRKTFPQRRKDAKSGLRTKIKLTPTRDYYSILPRAIYDRRNSLS